MVQLNVSYARWPAPVATPLVGNGSGNGSDGATPALHAALGLHPGAPVDELVLGPVRDLDAAWVAQACGLGHGAAACWAGGDTRDAQTGINTTTCSGVQPPRDGALPTPGTLQACLRRHLRAMERVALAAGDGSQQWHPNPWADRVGPGHGAYRGTSLRFRRPILLSHVHLGDALAPCPSLNVDGRWVSPTTHPR